MADTNDIIQYLIPAFLVAFLFWFCCAIKWSRPDKQIQVVKKKEIDL